MEAVFQDPAASHLTRMRIQTRRKRHLTYDCMNGIVKGDIVVCKKGYPFRARGRSNKQGISVIAILGGNSSSECRECQDYDEETDE